MSACLQEKDALPVTAACARCGHSIYLTGYIWLHANGLLFCDPEASND